MKKILLVLFSLVAAKVLAQTCIVNPPAAPPIPKALIVALPPDGGTIGCVASALVPGSPRSNDYPISNAKCAQAVAIAKQAAANDNGWNDGGVP